MSSTKNRIPLNQARATAQSIHDLLTDTCQQLHIAGSIRRAKPDVGDIELVALPHNPSALHNRLDTLVHNGVITKALYGEKQTTRWGDTLRAFRYKGIKVELEIANPNNIGYKLWLRTGPSDGNTFIMQVLAQKQAPIRFKAGHGWYTEYQHGQHPIYRHKLHLPNEQALFTALGMSYIFPMWRCERTYKAQFRTVAHTAYLRGIIVEQHKQQSMF